MDHGSRRGEASMSPIKPSSTPATVIVFIPWFVDYFNYIQNHDGVVKPLPTDENFLPELDVLEKNIGPKTKAILIDSPNNPTGVVYKADLMKKMAAILQRKEKEYGHDIYIVSDEPYKKLIYDGLKYPSPLSFHKHSIACGCNSKDLSIRRAYRMGGFTPGR